MPWKAQLAVFAVLAVAAGGAFYYFYEMPQQEQLTVRGRELATLTARIDKARATARQLAQFRQDVNDLQAELDKLRPMLPEEKDAADLLRRVNQLAVQSNLTIQAWRPQATETKEMHVEWPIRIQLVGTYHDLGRFLDEVSKVPRIINISNLEIDRLPNATAQQSIVVNCTATTFVLLDTPAAPPAKKGAASKAPAKTE